MLKLITSLSFLYALTIVSLIVYGLLYYRDFRRSAIQQKRFPIVFGVIAFACFSFLWINIHAPLRLKTFSNLDHHFIRHDGFIVNKSIELGRTDTVNFDNKFFNSVLFSKKNGQVSVASRYSEEPFYSGTDGKYQLLSSSRLAIDHSISFRCDSVAGTIRTIGEDNFELSLNNQVFKTEKPIRKGLTLWNLFKNENAFLNSSYYNDEKIINTLRNILILRTDVSTKEVGDLRYFITGRRFQYTPAISYDQQKLQLKDLAFIAAIPDKNIFAWGVGFLDNNKNQFRLRDAGHDSFQVINRYPVSYPLTEENSEDWSIHSVTKFLVSDSKDMLNMPSVFREGFLYPTFERNNAEDFAPVLMGYEKSAENKPLRLTAQWLNKPPLSIEIRNDELVLPAKSSRFAWKFSIQNTFTWDFGNRVMSASTWQWILFGSLFFFFGLIFFTSLITPPERLSWVWQLLTCVTIVLLTTRFFLYWRYKSFPPYDGMDLPSQQQLYSFWNFGIIIIATIVLAMIFGFGGLAYIGQLIRGRVSSFSGRSFNYSNRKEPVYEKLSGLFARSGLVRRFGAKAIFFASWLLVLCAGAALAYINHFDPGACRHLAIGLIIIYFIYGFISY